MPSADQPVVSVRDLTVGFHTARGQVHAVQGVSFDLHPGRCLAIVGESGSGKSVTARTLVGLTGSNAGVEATTLTLDGQDLTRLSDRQWRSVRGRRIGFVLQDALTSLDPVRTIGAEIGETLRNHHLATRATMPGQVVELLEKASVPDAERRAKQYAHQLSGGLRQRALIASAVAARPDVLIADEPTTALDVVVQAQILELLGTKKAEGTALLLISHDLAVVARLADEIAVMRDGRIVERGTAEAVLRSPSHEYTKKLLAAVPSAHPRGTRLAGPRIGEPAKSTKDPRSGSVVEVAAVSKSFAGPDGVRRTQVRDVSFTLEAGRILGLVGESGSGKTTVANMVLGLLEPDAGSVRVLDRPWSGQRESRRRPYRRHIQLVHQDPLDAFDPRYTVERIVGEALAAVGKARDRRARVTRWLHRVGLDEQLLDRRPRQLSGGQLQRLAIARALAAEPDVLVCDEPVSSLDVSVQAQILDLLADLRDDLGLSLLFISHDLGVVRHLCDDVLVMSDGEVVEAGPVEDVLREPAHEYTKSLVAAIPRIEDAFPQESTVTT
ncbi:ABC transporter ATP-binding protein [Lentzea sp.]|uniref:ABC transporter ATP-binding protein n=1 Tax=Lentzea sp. TaxID=56099 RepID=UPI002BE40112|nr:ABC transporter ATP-binding protein [Lentzea sp.]HUQ60125.1 ABC transporter ATP-binding protein [Lentzea sp.]